jgi:hypothetical protein
VNFNFDTTRTRASDGDVEWRTTHNRKPKTATEPMACGGGKDQLDESIEMEQIAPSHLIANLEKVSGHEQRSQ